MQEQAAPFGQREGDRTDSARSRLDVCSATADADVGRFRNGTGSCGGGGGFVAPAGRCGSGESGAISVGVSGSCWDVIGSNWVA